MYAYENQCFQQEMQTSFGRAICEGYEKTTCPLPYNGQGRYGQGPIQIRPISKAREQ